MKFVSGLLIGGLLVAIPSTFFILETHQIDDEVVGEMLKLDGPGVLKICDESLNVIECQTQMIGETSIPVERYGLWVKD